MHVGGSTIAWDFANVPLLHTIEEDSVAGRSFEPRGFFSEMWSLGHLCYFFQGSTGSPPSLVGTCVAAPVLFAELRQRLITGARAEYGLLSPDATKMNFPPPCSV